MAKLGKASGLGPDNLGVQTSSCQPTLIRSKIMEKLNVIQFINDATVDIYKSMVDNGIFIDGNNATISTIEPLVKMAVGAELKNHYMYGIYEDIKNAINKLVKECEYEEQKECPSDKDPIGTVYQNVFDKWIKMGKPTPNNPKMNDIVNDFIDGILNLNDAKDKNTNKEYGE